MRKTLTLLILLILIVSRAAHAQTGNVYPGYGPIAGGAGVSFTQVGAGYQLTVTGGGSLTPSTGSNGIVTTSSTIKQSQTVYYAMDYGAKCDDSTDDTTSIGSLFTAAAAGTKSAIVDFPTGTICKITAGVSINASYVSIRGNGAALDCSGFSSGTCLTMTGASSNPPLYKQNKQLHTQLELIGPGSGTAGVTGLKMATTTNKLADFNIHDFATGMDLSGNNSYAVQFDNLDVWNSVTAITTGSNNPTQSGETFDFFGGDIFNNTTEVSMLNTGGGYSLNFFSTHFDGMTGSTFVIATGASETGQVQCHGCHIEYTSAATAADMIQIGGSNQYTSFTSYGSNFQTDAGNINSIVNDTGSGQVYIDRPFLSISGYTTAMVTGTGAANVAIANGYTGSVNAQVSGTESLPKLTAQTFTNGTGNGTVCVLGAGNQYAIVTNGAACPTDFTTHPGLYVDDAGNDYLLGTTGHNINLKINNANGLIIGGTSISAQGGETIQSTGGAVPTVTCSGGSTGTSVTAGSTNNRGSFVSSSSASTNCTLTWSAAGSWGQSPFCNFFDAGASITPTAYSMGACGASTCVVDFASTTSKTIGYQCF